MSNGGTNGLATVLTLLGARGDAGVDDQAQIEMLEADAAMPGALPPVEAKSGPQGGRPKGARNKSTEAWRALFLSKFRHPMMVLGELTSRTPEELARDLKLYKFHEGRLVLDALGNPVLATGEAAKMRQDAAIALLPYLGQKLPMAIEVTPPRRGVVVIGELPLEDGEDDLALPLPPTEENQQVIEGESVRLSDEQSDAAPKALGNIGEFKDDV